MNDTNYVIKFDQNLLKFFRRAVLHTRVNGATTRFLLRTFFDQQRAVVKRSAWKARGVQVPPLMIVSITNQCNLHCVGCYARAIHPDSETEMSNARLFVLGDEAEELGISIILIAGGEPLLRPAFFELARLHPHIVFLVFTNGLLINDEIVQRFTATRNLVPILSLEGQQMETDMRRGNGIFKLVQQRMDLLHRRGLFFGTSLTLTNHNYDLVTSLGFQQELSRLGSRIAVFVDYVPMTPDTADLVLTPEQKQHQPGWMRTLESHVPGLFVALPGDEEEYGGCLAGGRGFIHVNPSGRLEACPFAPFSDTDLTQMSLKDALNSKLMRVIRENANKMSEAKGGCTLWENRDWVLSQMNDLK